MSESGNHRKYIEFLLSYTLKIVPSDCKKLILIDSSEATGGIIPDFTSEGYRPDLYYCHKNLLIIGEAKTSDDILRNHSKLQYKSYLKKCSDFEGESYLILATSWLGKPALSDHINHVIREYVSPPNVVILDELSELEK